jgi:type II secretory pathway component PulF
VKHDEFAFINRQLAGMLQAGIPLEGALRQICQGMREGPLREEFQKLETDLAGGAKLEDALSCRQLPAFYSAMLKVGVQSNQLPAVLVMLADYYQKINSLWTRLRALMIYPAIVLGASVGLSLLVAVLFGRFATGMGEAFISYGATALFPTQMEFALYLWLPTVVLAAAAVTIFLVLAKPSWRQQCRWRLPAFHEAGLAQLASALALMLEKGTSVPQALELLRNMEAGSPAGKEIEVWQQRLAAGHKQFAEIAAGGQAVPPLFVWLVAGSGEDWAGGFKHAAEIYYARAGHRIELLLYAVLPASVVALGILIVLQIVPITRVFLAFMEMLNRVGE